MRNAARELTQRFETLGVSSALPLLVMRRFRKFERLQLTQDGGNGQAESGKSAYKDEQAHECSFAPRRERLRLAERHRHYERSIADGGVRRDQRGSVLDERT